MNSNSSNYKPFLVPKLYVNKYIYIYIYLYVITIRRIQT